MKVRIYLLWQTIAGGRKQIRRYSPDAPNQFLGYERQSAIASAWLERNGNPNWPNDAYRFDGESQATPFYVTTMNSLSR